MRKKHFPNGALLIDLLTATFIIILAATTTTAAVINANHSLRASHDRLQGSLYAAEAADGMSAIVASNRLRYGKIDTCWNMRPDASTCSNANTIAEGIYVLNFSDGKWTLTPKNPELNEANEPTIENMTDVTAAEYAIKQNKNIAMQYYRFIKIIYPIVYPGIDVMRVTSRAQWRRGSNVKTVSLTRDVGAAIFPTLPLP